LPGGGPSIQGSLSSLLAQTITSTVEPAVDALPSAIQPIVPALTLPIQSAVNPLAFVIQTPIDAIAFAFQAVGQFFSVLFLGPLFASLHLLFPTVSPAV
jgi:hypothetical protein